MTALDAIRLAVGTFTVFPTPAPGRIDRAVAGVAVLLAPAAVLPVAALAGGGAWVVGRGAPPAVVAVLLVTALALYSRGLHLDGLADTVDGFGASYDRDQALAVMRRGDTGALGAAALVLALLLDVVSLAAVLGRAGGWALAVTALMTSRLALAWACRRGVPAARPDGLGATVAGSVRGVAALAATVVVGGLCLALAALTSQPWYGVALTVATGVAAGLVVVHRAVGRFGGITGDVLGAVIEVSLAMGLAAAALVP